LALSADRLYRHRRENSTQRRCSPVAGHADRHGRDDRNGVDGVADQASELTSACVDNARPMSTPANMYSVAQGLVPRRASTVKSTGAADRSAPCAVSRLSGST
jgi:hypothetical protein